jgi:hypothetical protein
MTSLTDSAPPPAELDRWLHLERFDYSRVGQHWAVLRMLAGLAGELGAPAEAMLFVQRGLESTSYPARACALERRLVGRRADHGASELLWRASFAVPLEVVEFQHAVFEFRVSGRVALALPAPGVPILTPQTLSFARRPCPADIRGHRIPVGQVRRRVVALATAVAVMTTSSPALSLAASDAVHSASGTAVPAHSGAATKIALHVTAAHKRKIVSSVPGRGRASSPSAPASRVPAAPAARAVAPKPEVTHVFSAPAQPATPAVCKPVVAPPTLGAHPTLAEIQRAAAQVSQSAGTTTQPNCPDPTAANTPQNAPAKRSFRTAHRHHLAAPHRAVAGGPAGHNGAGPGGKKNGQTTPPAADSTPAATTSRNTPTAASGANKRTAPAGRGNRSTATGGRAAHAHPRHRADRKDPSGGAPIDPRGSLSPSPPVTLTPTPPVTLTPTPPVKLTPRPATPNTPEPATPSAGGKRHTATGGQTSYAHQHPRGQSKDPSGGVPLGSLTARPGLNPGSHPTPANTREPATSTTGTTPTLAPTPASFSAPAAWTGTVSTDPSLAGAVTDLSALLANGNQPPAFLVPIYVEAGRRYHVPWQVLAAINAIESDYGRDLSTSSAGAIGWMQFEPATWRTYGLAVDGHSVANPFDPRDAIFAAARLLAAAGAAQNLSGAIFSYNHATWYVNEVLSRAQTIANQVHPDVAYSKRGVVSVQFVTKRSANGVATFKGGVMWHYDRLIAAANMVSAANFPYLYGGGHEQPAVFAPFDCSGAVSYVMQQAGYQVPTTVSGDIASWGFPAGPGRVTIFYNPTHTFMRIGDRYFGTSGFARPGGGAGWFDTNKLPASYLAGFQEVHVPHLGLDSFAPVTSASTATAGN